MRPPSLWWPGRSHGNVLSPKQRARHGGPAPPPAAEVVFCDARARPARAGARLRARLVWQAGPAPHRPTACSPQPFPSPSRAAPRCAPAYVRCCAGGAVFGVVISRCGRSCAGVPPYLHCMRKLVQPGHAHATFPLTHIQSPRTSLQGDPFSYLCDRGVLTPYPSGSGRRVAAARWAAAPPRLRGPPDTPAHPRRPPRAARHRLCGPLHAPPQT
jgi:hypothetical protein